MYIFLCICVFEHISLQLFFQYGITMILMYLQYGGFRFFCLNFVEVKWCYVYQDHTKQIIVNAGSQCKALELHALRLGRCHFCYYCFLIFAASQSLAMKNKESNTRLAKIVLPFTYLSSDSDPQFPSNYKWLPNSRFREIQRKWHFHEKI